jgi:hypothetical protein
VKKVIIEDVEEQSQPPASGGRFPDFIFGAMARRGIGSVEAIPTDGRKIPPAPVLWHYFSPTTATTEVVASVRHKYFRNILPQFAEFSGIDTYAGHALLELEWPVYGSFATHRFSIFLCNEPTMDFWIRIYLYGVDGFYPRFK